MDKILFLNFCFFDMALYAAVKYFAKLSHHSTIEVISYGNVACVMFLLPFAIYNWERTKKGFIPNLRLFIAAPNSALKTVAVGSLSIKNVSMITYLQPAVVVFMSFIMLGEYDKKDNKQFFWLALSFIGVMIFVGFLDIRSQSIMYALVFLHVLLKGLTNVFTKQLAEDRSTTLFYSKLHYAIFNVAIFIIMGMTPSWGMFFSKSTAIITFCLLITQYSLILSYKIAKKISVLQIIDYSKIFFSCLFGYLLFDDKMSLQQVIGLTVVIISIVCSHSAEFGMRRYSIIVLDKVMKNIKSNKNPTK